MARMLLLLAAAIAVQFAGSNGELAPRASLPQTAPPPIEKKTLELMSLLFAVCVWCSWRGQAVPDVCISRQRGARRRGL